MLGGQVGLVLSVQVLLVALSQGLASTQVLQVFDPPFPHRYTLTCGSSDADTRNVLFWLLLAYDLCLLVLGPPLSSPPILSYPIL